MTKITYIPGEIANAAIDEHGNRKPVTRTQYIFDDALNKPQSQVNEETTEAISAEAQRAQDAESTLDSKIALEKQRAEGVEGGLNTRLQTVEQLAEISIGGGDAQIATGVDFTNPDATKRAKVPTVGAIVDGLNDGIYDVSKRNPTAGPNSNGKFTLEYILSNADTLIPTGWRHGGMTISFVDSSDNNYVQFRLMANAFTTDVTQWQGVDDEPTAGSKNLVESGGIAQYNLNKISDYRNKFIANNASLNVRLNSVGELINPADGFFTSDYIPVAPGLICVKNSPVINQYHRACIYDIKKEFISPTIDNSNSFEIPQGGAYVRFSGVSTEIDTTTFKIQTAIDYFARNGISVLDKSIKEESLIVPFYDKKDETKNGITVEWVDDHRVYIHGTSTELSAFNLVYTRGGKFQNGKSLKECSPLIFLVKSENIELGTSSVRIRCFKKDSTHSDWTPVGSIIDNSIVDAETFDDILFNLVIDADVTVDGIIELSIFNNIANLVSYIKESLIKAESNSPGYYGLTDFNDMLENHVWLIGSDYTYDNKPNGMNLGFLFTINAGRWQLQLAYDFTGAKMWKRRGNSTGETWENWQEIAGVINNYTNEYNFPEYSNTYNISVNPSITTDTNAYLPSTGDNTDRTAEIVAMLQTYGVCRLGKGDYYVHNIDMPVRTMISGSGAVTKIILSGTTEDGYAIKMNNLCTVENVRIYGNLNGITLSDTVGNRHGILWQGTYSSDPTSANQPQMGIISNVHIWNCTGGGITCYNTGYGTFNHLEVNNVFCQYCNAGINISYWSEFHKFTNVRTVSCYYGCINNGGNNTFVNCDFSTCKVGFLMDNSTGQSPNNSHGQCVACVFNHTDNNTGVGIKILNCDNGFIFDACQIFFSQIYLVDSDGIVVSNSNFGNNNCNITISGGKTILFANNMYQDNPTITISNNDKVHFVNCYNRTTGASIQP